MSETEQDQESKAASAAAGRAPPSDNGESSFSQQPPKPNPLSPTLSRNERWNIFFLVASFSCVVASLTVIVGAGPLVVRSVGGSESMAPFALACFFLGMSLVSLTITHTIFDRYGRKIGFWFGGMISTAGAVVACVGLHRSSPPLVLIANVILGAGSGIGMYLRFASVEVVSSPFTSIAVTLVLSGGCVAAFVGPELAEASKGAFGDEEYLEYLGVFVVALCFFAGQAIFVGFVNFENNNNNNNSPSSLDKSKSEVNQEEVGVDSLVNSQDNVVEFPNTISSDVEVLSITYQIDNGGDNVDEHTNTDIRKPFHSLLLQSNFILPLLVSILAWAVMAMPMSIFRLAMHEVGFTDRQSLTVMEFHFLSMYAPGFYSGSFLQRYGTARSVQVGIICSLLGTVINLSSPSNTSTTVTWFLGLIFIGIGWNFSFSAATVSVTSVYQDMPNYKSKVQAANECGTFFFAGSLIFSTGYLYQDVGGGGLNGWKVLNYTILGLIGLLAATVTWAMKLEVRKQRQQQQQHEKE
jgi:MFS family permease